jgi:hypothetical protein
MVQKKNPYHEVITKFHYTEVSLCARFLSVNQSQTCRQVATATSKHLQLCTDLQADFSILQL